MRVTIFSSEMSGKESLGWIFAQGEGVGEGGCYWKITERGSITCMLKPIFHIAIFQTRTWLFCRACIHTYTYQHIPTQGFGSWPTLKAYLRKCPPPSPGTFDIIICEKHMLSYLLNQKIGKEFWKKLIIKTYLSSEIIIYM